jgi:hypothetical protein
MPGTIFEFQLPEPSAQDPEPISTPEITKTMMGRKDKEIRTELQQGNSLTQNPTDGIKEININMKEYRKTPDPKYWLSFIAAANSQSTHIYYNKTPETNFTGVNHPITGSYGNTTMKQSGGRDRIHIKSLKRSTTGVDLGVKSITHYFAGHSPQGYIGACIKVAEDGKYYVCVDVSKIDAQTYKNIDRYTCCCLIVEPIPKAEGGGGGGMKKRIIGRFVLENKYIMDQAQKSMLPEKCYVHYDHEINDDRVLTDRYIGLPELTYMTAAATRKLKFSYIVTPNFEKEVTITPVNAEGERGSSSGKEGGSRKKRSYKVKKRSSTRGRTRK